MRRRGQRIAWGTAATALVAALLLLPPASADELGGVAIEARSAALRARKAGRTQEAVDHLLVGLGRHPTSPTLLLDLVETTKGDPDAHALWSHALVAAIADDKGKFKLPKESAALLDDGDASLAEVARARARAMRDLAKEASRLKGPGSYVLALAYRDLGLALSRKAPPLWKAHGKALTNAVSKTLPTVAEVVAAMRKAAGAAGGPDPAGAKLEIGRALRGMAAQARQKASGSTPAMAGKLESLGESLVREAEAALASEQMEPLTIAALRAMDEDAVVAFNAAHANVRRPGRALSEKGRYLIVTPNGHGTLLAAAETADATHDRIARWLGTDPWAGAGKAQGVIKVFPRYADLEAEAAPYWWASGFQRGAETVIHFGAERKIELARLLSHELTHRFDALLHPGLPGWLVEGRAVWTAGAFASRMGGDFVENYVDGGQVGDAAPGLYGDAYWLKRFLGGPWEEYRDNYTAGHALWVYLLTWEEGDGKKVYAPRLKAYLEAQGKGSKDEVGLFTEHFADGKDGRPGTIEAFAVRFGRFLMGWRSVDDPPWFSRYKQYVGDDAESPYVLDAPNWSAERVREEPAFGQDHPGRAARILAECGQVRPAIGLLEWSLAIDDFDAGTAEYLAQLLEKDGREEAALALRGRLAFRAPEGAASWLPRKHAVGAFADALGGAAEDYAKRKLSTAAAFFRNRQRRVLERLGTWSAPDGTDASPPASPLFPRCGAAVHLAIQGYVDEELSGGYDDFGKPGLWRRTAEGDLVVGNVKAGTAGAGGVAGSPYVFVRSDRPIEGRYTLSGRIALLSPHVVASIVLGWQRRDRNVRFRFEAGHYAQEDRVFEPDERLDAIEWRVTGMRYRDRRLHRAEPTGRTRLGSERNEFGYEIDVEGDTVVCRIDGQLVATFTDASGLAVAGFAGFAVTHGAIRVEQPRVRFHGADPHAPCPHGFPLGHDPVAPMRDIDSWLVGRRIVGAPRSPRGSILLWFPLPYLGADASRHAEKLADAASDMKAAAKACRRMRCAPAFAVYVPRKWPDEARQAFADAAKAALGADVVVREHREGLGRAAGVDPDNYGYSVYAIFQDPHGVVRSVSRGSIDSDDEELAHWIRIFR